MDRDDDAAGERNHRDTVARLLQAILAERSSPGEILASLQDLYALFGELGGSDQWQQAQLDRETRLPSGTAISPGDAGRCLLEVLRTRQFLRGVDAALANLGERFPERPLRVVYAGSGPYATLIMPLLSRFPPGELEITLLDAHQQNLACVRKLADALGHAAFFGELLCRDACEYRHDPGAPPHLVIAEVLQRALDKEPQVAVTMNLAPQLADGGIFLPERIAVNACLANLSREFTFIEQDDAGAVPVRRRRWHLEELVSLDLDFVAAAATRWNPADPDCLAALAGGSVRIPALDELAGLSLILQTHIRVYGEHCLGDYDCSLTTPKTLDASAPLQAGEQIEFRYQVGGEPGFRFTVSNAD